jgi:hypothetical protein
MEAVQLTQEELEIITNRRLKEAQKATERDNYITSERELCNSQIEKEIKAFNQNIESDTEFLKHSYSSLVESFKPHWKIVSKEETKIFSKSLWFDSNIVETIKKEITFKNTSIQRGDIKISCFRKHPNQIFLTVSGLYDNKKNANYTNINTIAKRVDEYIASETRKKEAENKKKTLLERAENRLKEMYPDFEVSVKEEGKLVPLSGTKNKFYTVIEGTVIIPNGVKIILNVDQKGIYIKAINCSKINPEILIKLLSRVKAEEGLSTYESAKISIN